MRYPHRCSVYRLMTGENDLGGNINDIVAVAGLSAQPCLYSTERVMGQSNEGAELLQAEQAFMFFPLGTDVQKGDVIKSIRFSDGALYKASDYTVETFVTKASILTGPSHLKAELKEIP